MTKEELGQIAEMLKEHLKIEIAIEGGDYGSSTYIVAKLILNDEVISSTTEYLPR